MAANRPKQVLRRVRHPTGKHLEHLFPTTRLRRWSPARENVPGANRKAAHELEEKQRVHSAEDILHIRATQALALGRPGPTPVVRQAGR
jgi:hypothetical protein